MSDKSIPQYNARTSANLRQQLKVTVKAEEQSPVRNNNTPKNDSAHLYMTRTWRHLPGKTDTYDEVGTDATSFGKLHKLIYDIIVEWATTQEDARKHKFYQIWLAHWKHSIKPTNTFRTVQDKLQLKNIAEYKHQIS